LNSFYSLTPQTIRRTRTLLAIVAGVISIVITGTLMGWTASADPRSTTTSTASDVQQIDIDSLYSAHTAETETMDTASISVIPPDRTFSGKASWYGPGFHGRRTANGERFNTTMLTAAHKSLPFGTIVRVTEKRSGKTVLVRINDRGPYCGGRVLDLSEAAARRIGIKATGTGSVTADVYSTPKDGSLLAFNRNGEAASLKGFTVRVKSYSSFEEARARQNELTEKGYDAWMIQDRTEGSTRYHVTIGLYGTQRLGENLMVEAVSEFGNAGLIRLDGTTMSSVEVATR
jgi:rare lipoprotein A